MYIPDNIKKIARELRKNLTKAEKMFWNKVRYDTLWERVLRQKIFYVYTENSWLDRFIIPDFYIARKKLIIEIDGWIHKLDRILELDTIKSKLIEKRGFHIIRITNEEIYADIDWVITKLKNFIEKIEDTK